MNNNYCSECGTENEPIYKYCKNCGAKLHEEVIINEPIPVEAPKNDNSNTYSEPTSNFDTIGGIPAEEMAIFVGAKQSKILPKFRSLEQRNSKVHWCWPLAILGYLIGPLGCSLWFFYRKMYKKAFLLLGIGFAVHLIYSVLTLGTEGSLLNTFSDFENFARRPSLDLLLDYDVSATLKHLTAELINNGATLACFILCSLFGYNAYKNHCVEKINEYKLTSGDFSFYRFGLASIGGVSGGMLTLGIILSFVSLMLCGVIAGILSIPL